MVVAMVLFGCGSDEPSINGNWYAEVNGACGIAATFVVSKSTYSIGMICSLSNGSFGMEMEVGDADFSVPGQVSLVPRKATCPTSDHTSETDAYSFNGSSLVIVAPSGAVAFKPNRESGGEGAVSFGCWTMGTLEPHPLKDL